MTELSLHNPDLISDLKRSLSADKRNLLDEINELDAALDVLEQGPNLLSKGWFTVHIYDPWDNSTSRPASGKATARGLQNAVEESEKEYMKRGGFNHVRDDGVLKYSVYLHLGDKDISVPDRFWSFYTATGKKETASKEKV